MALAMLVAETQHLGETEGRREHRADLILDADFDALRDRDLTLAREQRDLTHLAQVHAHGVVARTVVLVVADVVAGGLRRTRARTRGVDTSMSLSPKSVSTSSICSVDTISGSAPFTWSSVKKPLRRPSFEQALDATQLGGRDRSALVDFRLRHARDGLRTSGG